MSYDFEIDLVNPNSLLSIINGIEPISSVYDIGCSHGRLGKYLSQQKQCEMYGCDVSSQALLSALNFYKYALQIDLDKDDFSWILDKKFDYIVFADVLEHLKDPAFALSKSKSMLKENGFIWISIPNISHNSVLIDLMLDKFEYKEYGLLDKTHIKFFTESSLEKFVTEQGYVIKEKHNLKNSVENTEFMNSYNDIPSHISSYLKQRKNGETYQFVWKLQVGC